MINGWEFLILVLLGVVIFGPERLPEVARKTARVLAYLRGIANDATQQVRDGLGPEYGDLQLTDLNPRTFVTRHLLGEFDDVRAELRSVADDAAGAGIGRTTTGLGAGSSPSAGREAADPSSGGRDAEAPKRILWDPEST